MQKDQDRSKNYVPGYTGYFFKIKYIVNSHKFEQAVEEDILQIN